MIYFMTMLVLLLSVLGQSTKASPTGVSLAALQSRTDPVFPDTPASCPICAQNYPSISSCAQAAPVLANFTNIIFNPGAFIDVIKCACTDTFQSVFPQCVDCFQQTNQTDVLNTPDLPSVINGMRQVCALASSLLGGVASADGEIPSSSVSPTSTAAASTDGGVTATGLPDTSASTSGALATNANLGPLVATAVVLLSIFTVETSSWTL